MEIVLASTSVYRRAQIEQLGIPLIAEPSGVDEDAVKAEGLAPQALAEKLALMKAEAVAATRPSDTVIGGDQLAELDGQVLGKPGTAARAVDQLTMLAGRTHTLITAIAVISKGELKTHTDVTRMTMRALDRAALERYVAADQPLDCAASYKTESRGIALFEKIESDDHSAITGLPLLALVTILRSFGHPIP